MKTTSFLLDVSNPEVPADAKGLDGSRRPKDSSSSSSHEAAIASAASAAAAASTAASSASSSASASASADEDDGWLLSTAPQNVKTGQKWRWREPSSSTPMKLSRTPSSSPQSKS